MWTAPLRRPLPVLRYAAAATRASVTLRGNFLLWSARWLRAGGDPRWAVHPETWLMLRDELDRLPSGTHVLELGSGLAGLLTAARGHTVTSVDHSASDLERFRTVAERLGARTESVLAPLVEVAGVPGYDFSCIPDQRFALVFVDGPPGDVGRRGVALAGRALLDGATAVVLDDTDRREERELAEEIASLTGRAVRFGRAAAVVG